MEIGMIGIGRMGAGLVRRLMKAGHSCVVFDQNKAQIDAIAKDGAIATASFEDLIHKLKEPRTVWIMVPAEIVDKVISQLTPLLSKGDIMIDGGNSFYQDDVRRAHELEKSGIRYVDMGTSGGVFGEHRGFCLMCGGEKSAFDHIQPILKTLAPEEKGYLYCGPSGAGHFVKMVHNGIEYGMMASLAEGLNVLKGANIGKSRQHGDAETAPIHNAEFYQYDFNLAEVTEVWRHGSVISSWLLDLTADALSKNPDLTNFSGRVSDSGEGRWTIQAAIDEGIPTPTLSAALFERFSSQGKSSFGDQVLSAMRFEFGGHIEKSH